MCKPYWKINGENIGTCSYIHGFLCKQTNEVCEFNGIKDFSQIEQNALLELFNNRDNKQQIDKPYPLMPDWNYRRK